jgi:hypothetical protein
MIRVITDFGGMMTVRQTPNIRDRKLAPPVPVRPSQILVMNPGIHNEKLMTNHGVTSCA